MFRPVFRTPLFSFMLAILFVLLHTSAEAHASKGIAHPVDSVIVKKLKANRRYTIRIYPNATQEVLFFSAAGAEGRLYELYVFDMDGKLIRRIQVRNRETTVLDIFEKGSYLFEVFSNDERIENGSLIIQ